MIIALLILAMCGAIIGQDAIASMAFYKGREGRKNQAFRVVRLLVGILIIMVTIWIAGR